MTRLALAFALVAATSSASLAEDAPTDGGANPDAAPAAAAAAKQKAKNVPPAELNRAKISGEAPRLPYAIKARFTGSSVSGIYKICVDTHGNVSSVQPIVWIPAGGDDVLVAGLRAWKFKPQEQPICSVSRFMYLLR